MFNYNDIIEYIDGTYDENFNNARKWAYSHNASFNELIDRRQEIDGRLHRFYEIKEIIVPPLPPLTDAEIVAIRERLYPTQSDRLFASYQQGVGSLQDYIDDKARIGFENKKSTQANMTLDDFKHKVSREYQLFKQQGITAEQISYKYVENNGTDDMVVGSETITMLRPSQPVKVILPAITDVQIVKIDNVSDGDVVISSVAGVDGQSGDYTLQSKDVVEFISDKSANTWDLYTAPLEIESTSLSVGFLANPDGGRKGVSNIIFGRGITGYTDPNSSGVVVELPENSRDVPCYYASMSAEETILGDAPIWFDDVIIDETGAFIQLNETEKSIGVQDWTGNDDNITGGEDMLVSARLPFVGNAEKNGYITCQFVDTRDNSVVKDAQGKDMLFTRSYVAGQELGVLNVAGVLKVKGLQNIQLKILNRLGHPVKLADYTTGNACIVIQGLSKLSRSGNALRQYAVDTGDNPIIDKDRIFRGFRNKDISGATFEVRLDNPQGSYRFSGSEKLTKIPLGKKVSGSIPAILKPWDVQLGYADGNENNWVFSKDCTILVSPIINYHSPKQEVVYYYLTADGKEIQGTRSEFFPQAEHEQKAVLDTIKADVKKGAEIGLAFETSDGGYLETDDMKYPLVTVMITVEGA